MTPQPAFQNHPRLLTPATQPAHSPWTPEEVQEFTREMVAQVAASLGLKAQMSPFWFARAESMIR